MLILLLAVVLLSLHRYRPASRQRHRRRARRTDAASMPVHRSRYAPKPQWVVNEIIRYRAMHPDEGCRKIAAHFNRQFAGKRGVSVSKSYVAGICRRHEADIRLHAHRVKHRIGTPSTPLRVLGLDLTGKTDRAGRLHMILGLVDHGSRANLALTALHRKSTIAILRVLLDAIERYGAPRIVRTDNEAVFTSRLFRFVLACLGIRHRTTDLHCPWMNGRIERLFGTLKHKLNRWSVPDRDTLEESLAAFRLWYNHVRPHQHLYDRTPAEIWNGTDVFRRQSDKRHWFSAWDGLLTGYYLPP